MEIPGYQIQRQIGRGGMATVYLAIQESLGRPVVLKVMATQVADSPEFAKRFLNEGHHLASVNHPNIITIYDIGIAEDFLYISMEYLGGHDLTTRLGNGMPPHEALGITYQIADALAVAHAKGIVHRDVKPANILFRDDNTPVLTDFGIAKQIGDNELTATGTILGSPYYMSPEQVEGKVELDGRSDIYGLGIILFEMLTARRPYEGDSAINIVLQHLQSPLPRLPGSHQAYQPLLNLMLAKRREDRFPDAHRLKHYIATLQPAVAPGKGGLSLPAGTEPAAGAQRYRGGHVTQQLKVVRWKRIRTWSILGLGILVIAAVLGWYFSHEIRRYEALTVSPEAPPTAVAAAPGATAAADIGPLRDQVTTALEWLAKRAVDENRLVSPPQDNAHYYYRRLLEVTPDSETARQGLARIGERFASLAQAQVGERNYELARRYVEQGLEVDPDNKRLQVLRSNLQLREKSLLESVLDFVRDPT